MKIIGSTSPVGSGGSTEGARTRPANGAAPRPAASGDTQVELSSRMQEIEATISTAPAVDTKRVAEIRQAIAEGRFKVNPERIADSLLSSVRDMLAKEH